jgi:hypothetical protein
VPGRAGAAHAKLLVPQPSQAPGTSRCSTTTYFQHQLLLQVANAGGAVMKAQGGVAKAVDLLLSRQHSRCASAGSNTTAWNTGGINLPGTAAPGWAGGAAAACRTARA